MLNVKFAPLAESGDGIIVGHGSATIGQGTEAGLIWDQEHGHNHYNFFGDSVCPWDLGEPNPNEEESIAPFAEVIEPVPEIVDGE